MEGLSYSDRLNAIEVDQDKQLDAFLEQKMFPFIDQLIQGKRQEMAATSEAEAWKARQDYESKQRMGEFYAKEEYKKQTSPPETKGPTDAENTVRFGQELGAGVDPKASEEWNEYIIDRYKTGVSTLEELENSPDYVNMRREFSSQFTVEPGDKVFKVASGEDDKLIQEYYNASGDAAPQGKLAKNLKKAGYVIKDKVVYKEVVDPLTKEPLVKRHKEFQDLEARYKEGEYLVNRYGVRKKVEEALDPEKMTDDDRKAYNYYMENKNDPVAIKILKKLNSIYGEK